jgi:hypothetical protein
MRPSLDSYLLTQHILGVQKIQPPTRQHEHPMTILSTIPVELLGQAEVAFFFLVAR